MTRSDSYGQHGLTVVDRFGVWLSRRPVVRALRPYRLPRALDLGCGYDAKLLRQLAAENRIGDSTAVDVRLSDAVKADPKLTPFESTIESALPTLESTSFDVVLLLSVLEHLEHACDVLRHCHRVLRPEGSVIINVPNWLGKKALEFSAFRLGLSPAAEMDDHKMYYSKRDLWPVLVRAGFKPSQIRMRYHKFGLNLFAVATVP